MKPSAPSLPWLEPGQIFPPVEEAWGRTSAAPGLLAAGGDLTVQTLRAAYTQGVFPWFSEGQPILWWSPDPRMVLSTASFKLHRSMRKTLHRFHLSNQCEVRFDTVFEEVIRSCATSDRGTGQTGTWIVEAMVKAYVELHRAGLAHSVETWIDGQLQGGLYCVAIGRAVFGESMFSRSNEASKIALSALVSFCRHHGIVAIDCQQNTRHLASLGATEIPRAEFVAHVHKAAREPSPEWHFDALYWQQVMSRPDRQT